MAIAEPEPTTSPRQLRRAGTRRRGLAVALALPAMVQPAARLLARADWRADLLTHFQVPALVASVVASAALWRVGRHRWAAAAMAALAASQAAELLRYDLAGVASPSTNPTPAGPGRIKVLSANVLASNRDHRALIDLVARERPDVVSVVEFDIRWRQAMGPLRGRYPHHIEIPDGTRGIALYSRFPIRQELPPVVVRPFGDGNPALCVTLATDGGRPLHLWILHPPSPLGPDGRSRGRSELLALARAIADRPGPTLVVGDMNRTEGSPTFADFLRVSGLRDSRPGFGRQPSWPSWLPYRLPIDHAFLSPDLAVTDRRLGPPIGSDHLPLLVEVAPASARAAITEATQRSRSPASP